MDGRTGSDGGWRVDGEPPGCSRVARRGLRQWICRDQAEMVEQALIWPMTPSQLKQQRLQQRPQVARVNCSTMPA